MAMTTCQLDEMTQRAIRMSLESFKLHHLALLGIYPDEPLIETTSKVLSSPLVAPFDAESSSSNHSKPAAFELDSHVRGQDEILIAVMGATGTGKTTFINLVAGRDIGEVGKSLQYGTGEVTPYSISYGGKNFTLIDTPGFDDCHHSDTDILRKISDWLVESYRQNQKLTAILYLTRVSDPRMQGSPLSNLKMFKELCGEDCYRNIVLGTTFWEVTDSKHPGLAERREKELVEEFWADMIAGGSEVMRMPENRWLARELLMRLAKRNEMTLKNQKERADQNIVLDATAASSVLQETERLKAKYEEEIKERQMRMEREEKEREERLKKGEEIQAAELKMRLEEQRKENQRIEQEKVRHEKESQRQKAEAKMECERVEKEQSDLVETLKKVTKEKEIQERKRKRIEFSKQKYKANDRLKVANQMKNMLAIIREPNRAYMLCCDNCFRNIGAQMYYQCDDALCKTKEGDNFVVCAECHATSGVHCNDKGHWSSMKKVEKIGTENQCKRIMNPPSPGIERLCHRCSQTTGAVYFHCCACPGDNFDICLNCVTTLHVCRKPWSINGHPLNMCARYSGTL